MSKNILIVESDSALSRSMRESLAHKGFAVQETTDGKGTVDLVRKHKPELVVLAVDLSAGQNGYIICSKLKKDDELKTIPVVIIGKPDGFAQHRKMPKTRADDYVAKPFDGSRIVEVVGALIGMPELPEGQDEVVEDESLSLSELLNDSNSGEHPAGDDLSLDSHTSEEVVPGDPDLDMLDSVFDEKNARGSDDDTSPPEDSIDLPIEEELNLDDENVEKTVVGFTPSEAPPPPPPASAPTPPPPPMPMPRSSMGGAPGSSAAEHAELLELRAKVTELTGSLEDARERAADLDGRLREQESTLEAKHTELEAARAGVGGKSDKEVFALRDAANKKDKEILRLKNELNEKEQVILELNEKENALDQQVSESSGELARRDAQIKTLTTKSDQLSAERKKIDQSLISAKEEARSASARLSTMQTEVEELQGRLSNAETELDQLREEKSELDRSKGQLDSDLAEARSELETTRAQLDDRSKEADDARTTLESAQIDLDSAKSQLTTQATAFAEEASSLRKRISDLEDTNARQDERLGRLQSRLRTAEETKARVRQDISTALQLLDESPAEDLEELSDEEIAEA